MNMVIVAADFYWRTFQCFTNTTDVAVKFFFYRFINKWLTMFCTEDNVYIVLY